MKNKGLIIALVIWIVTASVFAFAQGDERLEAKLERNAVSIGNPLYLYLTFYGSQDVESPSISPIDGLKIQYLGPSTKILVVNGVTSQSITHTYLIFPQKSGEYAIGPFSAEYQGMIYKADAMKLSVNGVPSPSAAAASQPASTPYSQAMSAADAPEGSSPYKSDRVFLTMDISKPNMYINEEVTLTIKLYVYDAGLKDIEYPTYAHEGFSTGELEEPQRQREFVHGGMYDVLIFKQKLFGIKEGDYVLGPAMLSCNLMIRRETTRRPSYFSVSFGDDDFFSSRFGGYTTYPIELESNNIPVSVLGVPDENRPADFQGAVGDFKMDAYINPKTVKAGDPIELRVTISGKGDFDTVTAPKVSSDSFKVYEPQVVKKDNQKVYEQILIPKDENVKEVPALSFSFFNPSTNKYEQTVKGPFPITVTKRPESDEAVKMVSMPGVEQIFYPREELGKDIISIKEEMGALRKQNAFLYKNWVFWSGQALPLILFIMFYATHREKERILRDKGYARFVRAPRKARKGLAKAKACVSKNDTANFYDVVFKTLQQYLADRFNLPIGMVTTQVIEERLEKAGCEKNVIDDLRDVFSRCEMTRYASFAPGGKEAEEVLEKVKRVLAYVERIKL